MFPEVSTGWVVPPLLLGEGCPFFDSAFFCLFLPSWARSACQGNGALSGWAMVLHPDMILTWARGCLLTIANIGPKRQGRGSARPSKYFKLGEVAQAAEWGNLRFS